ncbi:MAG: SOS response-associated peptidase, partial [Pseudohongiellaceae bacterium]
GMRWGLIPNWATAADSKYSTFNARAETIDSKPAFKHAWSHSRRCLLPARGYYEWHLEEGAKQPYFVSLPPEIPMTMAGLFEPARGTEIPASCAILTCAASGPLALLHNRMPVMLPISMAGEWFSASPQQALAMLGAGQDLPLTFYPVSKRVNNARNDDAELIDPITRTAAML